jgi:hypothetical protein
MLIEYLGGAIAGALPGGALGFGPAETSAVGVGLFCRFFPFDALPEALQIDHVCHVRLHHPATLGHDESLALKLSSGAQANWMVIRNPRVALSDNINK